MNSYRVPYGSAWVVLSSLLIGMHEPSPYSPLGDPRLMYRRGDVLLVGDLEYDYVRVLAPQGGWLSSQIFCEGSVYLMRVA